MLPIDVRVYPLCSYLLSGYLSKHDDPINFPDQCEVLLRYEEVFSSALTALAISAKQLKHKSEFNFDSGDPANLEAGIATLRIVSLMHLKGFSKITLISPVKGKKGADIIAHRCGCKTCFEVKAITKQSAGRAGEFFADQLYTKMLESAFTAAAQLRESAMALECNVKILSYVVNWFAQSIYLGERDFQKIVNKLERDGGGGSLKDVDGVWLLTQSGQDFLFLNETGKRIDC